MQPSQDSSNNQAGQDPSKLYVGNLPYSVTEDDLRDMFGEHGEVEECKLITDFRSGRSKGFGFVKFAEEAMATAAIEALNEQEVQGRKLFVKVAQPPKPRSDRRSFDRRDNRRGDHRGGYDNRR